MSTEARTRGSGPLTGGERGAKRLPSSISTPEDALAQRQSAPPPLDALRKLSPAEFNTAMIHFYRGEIQRSNTWRNRLDTTTNWAVITAGATLSFAFSSDANPHFVIIINSVLVAYFLFMEARRYRYYEIWSNRVRVLETGYFAQLLTPQSATDKEWAEHLAADLLTPNFTISEWEAVGRRLRRNYLWIFILLALSWNLKVYLHPRPAPNFHEFIERATVGFVPGWMIFTIGVIFNAGLLVFAIATLRLREATGEVLPRHQFSLRSFRRVTSWRRADAEARSSTLRRAKRARQRVRTTGSLSSEVKRPEKAEKEAVPEETLTR